jgi:hypothetical protein
MSRRTRKDMDAYRGPIKWGQVKCLRKTRDDSGCSQTLLTLYTLCLKLGGCLTLSVAFLKVRYL